MPAESMNELTFVARLGAQTAVRRQRLAADGVLVLIASGEVEERQVDGHGVVRRCDIRLNSQNRVKLASGEMKRPEVAEGRDVRNPALINDARRKAVARGLPFYFTCNMAELVLFSVGSLPGQQDHEEAAYTLSRITHSRQVEAYWPQIAAAWDSFLDDLEGRLRSVFSARPNVSNEDVLALRDAIYEVADEALDRTVTHVESDATLADRFRSESANTFGFVAALKPTFRDQFREELRQMLCFGTFVIAQKLVLYRVLQDAGPRRRTPFELDVLTLPDYSSDPTDIEGRLSLAFQHAVRRSRDYETAFLPRPLASLVFLPPVGGQETADCRVGTVWSKLLNVVDSVSWVSISQNLVGLLYEVIIDPSFRHLFGQFYTPEDVVDILVAYAIRNPGDSVLDPASGAGSFLRSGYRRKRALGESHEGALADVWGFEIAAFAAELSTITLVTSETAEPAAYPRVMLMDFFDARPGMRTELQIPDEQGSLCIPPSFDAIVGNPPYISYRRQTNQGKVINALATLPRSYELPRFTGKSDAYVWFLVHATQFLKEGGRLAFVVSSGMLFSNYGIPLIRFLGRNYRIEAVVDSIVERWFPDADTNTVLLLLERCSDSQQREQNQIRFVRLRRTLATLLPPAWEASRRQSLEDLIESILHLDSDEADPRFAVNLESQGRDGGLQFLNSASVDEELLIEEEE
jgi:hypothetical protein